MLKNSLVLIVLMGLSGCGVDTALSSDDVSSSSENPTVDENVEVKSTSTSVENPPSGSDNIEENLIDESSMSVRSAESHTHGDAELAIVLENGSVTVEFETPLYNLLEFEHIPDTEQQKSSVSRAENLLASPDKLFSLNRQAGCKGRPQNQGVKLFGTHDDKHDHHAGHEISDSEHNHEDKQIHHDEHEDHEDHRNDHNDHDDSPDHEAHDDHRSHDDHAEHDELGHKDLVVVYEFECQNLADLSTVTINLFEFFDELTEIDATYLSPIVQRQDKITRKNNVMDLKP